MCKIILFLGEREREREKTDEKVMECLVCKF